MIVQPLLGTCPQAYWIQPIQGMAMPVMSPAFPVPGMTQGESLSPAARLSPQDELILGKASTPLPLLHHLPSERLETVAATPLLTEGTLDQTIAQTMNQTREQAEGKTIWQTGEHPAAMSPTRALLPQEKAQIEASLHQAPLSFSQLRLSTPATHLLCDPDKAARKATVLAGTLLGGASLSTLIGTSKKELPMAALTCFGVVSGLAYLLGKSVKKPIRDRNQKLLTFIQQAPPGSTMGNLLKNPAFQAWWVNPRTHKQLTFNA